MKVFPVLIALWAVNILSVQAQTLTFQISYDEVEAVRGELYQYSERYLGTKDALTESGITYVLRSIDITETDSPQCCKQSRAEKRFGTHRFQKRNADSKKGQVIIFRCKKCGQIRKNKVAEDDDFDAIIKVVEQSKFLI